MRPSFVLPSITGSAIALLLSGCAARFPKIEVAAPRAPTSKTPLNGVLFTLPKTALTVELSLKRNSETEGQYCQFNNLFWPGAGVNVKCTKSLDADGKAVDPSLSIEISSLRVAPRGVPDPSKRFVLPMGSKATVDATDSLELTEAGTISGAESTRTDRTEEVILATVNAAAGIAGKVLAAGAKLTDKMPVNETFIDKFTEGLDAPVQTILRINFALLDDPAKNAYVDLWKMEGNPYRELLKARRAFADAMAIVKRRDGILTGVGSGLGTGIVDLLNTNNDLFDKLSSRAFFGTQKSVAWNPVYDIAPATVSPATWNTAGFSQDIPLFRTGKGCFDNASPDLVRNALPSSVLCKSSGANNVTLKLEPATLNQMANIIDSFYNEPTQPSYPFTIPANVRISVSGMDAPPPPQTVALAQWGTLNHFPVGKGAKGRTLKVTYYEATGALKSVKFGSDAPLNKGVVDSLASSANSVLDGKQKADGAAAAKADELAKLTKQRQILEEMDKIAKLCATLGVACGN